MACAPILLRRPWQDAALAPRLPQQLPFNSAGRLAIVQGLPGGTGRERAQGGGISMHRLAVT